MKKSLILFILLLSILSFAGCQKSKVKEKNKNDTKKEITKASEVTSNNFYDVGEGETKAFLFEADTLFVLVATKENGKMHYCLCNSGFDDAEIKAYNEKVMEEYQEQKINKENEKRYYFKTPGINPGNFISNPENLLKEAGVNTLEYFFLMCDRESNASNIIEKFCDKNTTVVYPADISTWVTSNGEITIDDMKEKYECKFVKAEKTVQSLDFYNGKFEYVVADESKSDPNLIDIDYGYNDNNERPAIKGFIDIFYTSSNGKTMYIIDQNDLWSGRYNMTTLIGPSNNHKNMDALVTNKDKFSMHEWVVSRYNPSMLAYCPDFWDMDKEVYYGSAYYYVFFNYACPINSEKKKIEGIEHFTDFTNKIMDMQTAENRDFIDLSIFNYQIETCVAKNVSLTFAKDGELKFDTISAD